MVINNTVIEQILMARILISSVDELRKTGAYAIGLLPYLQDPYGKAHQELARLALASNI
jgi:hypothetical protein